MLHLFWMSLRRSWVSCGLLQPFSESIYWPACVWSENVSFYMDSKVATKFVLQLSIITAQYAYNKSL